jgi:hypothetical protein
LPTRLRHLVILRTNDVKDILSNLIDRVRFTYTFGDILKSALCCLKPTKTHAHLLVGERKLRNELDVITLVRAVRELKLLTHVLLNQRQRFLLRFQRKNLLESNPQEK